MSKIKRTKRNESGVIIELEMDYDEYLSLQGHLENIHVIAETKGMVKTNISQRGTNGATKYFLIPRELRKGFKLNNEISCQRLDTDDKALFVYVVDKTKFNISKRALVLKKYEPQEAEALTI